MECIPLLMGWKHIYVVLKPRLKCADLMCLGTFPWLIGCCARSRAAIAVAATFYLRDSWPRYMHQSHMCGIAWTLLQTMSNSSAKFHLEKDQRKIKCGSHKRDGCPSDSPLVRVGFIYRHPALRWSEIHKNTSHWIQTWVIYFSCCQRRHWSLYSPLGSNRIVTCLWGPKWYLQWSSIPNTCAPVRS